MTVVARLQLQAGTGGQPGQATREFLTWTTERGWSPDKQVPQLEELAASGLDNVRYRITRLEFPLFQAAGISVHTNYAAAVQAAQTRDNDEGRVGTLTLNTNGYSASFPIVIVSCNSRVYSAIVAGQTGTGVCETTYELRRLADGSEV